MSSGTGTSVLRRITVGAVGVLVVVGLGLAAVFVSVSGLVALALVGAGAGWGWTRSGRPWPRRLRSGAVVVPLAVVAAMGWAMAGSVVVPVVAVGLTWAAAVRAQRTPGRSCPVSVPGLPAAAAARGDDLDRWTDAQLCQVWRATYRPVSAARTPQTLVALVDCRRVIMDQLELRDPAGFTAWIDAGARAAGDPEPYLST